MSVRYFAESDNGELHLFDSLHERMSYLTSIAESDAFVIDALTNKDFHVKIECVNEDFMIESVQNHFQVFCDIKDLDITPALISFKELTKIRVGSLYHDEKQYDDGFGTIYAIVTQRYGESLANKFFEYYDDDLLIGPCATDIINDDTIFDIYFSPINIPEDIRSQIRPLLLKLQEVGWEHNDVHAGNFLVDNNNNVKIIDFNCVSRRFL